jgi:hypothetical protein
MPLKLVLAVAGLASALGAAAADPRDVPLQVHATLVRLLQVARLPARTPVRLVAVDGPGRAAISDAGTVFLLRADRRGAELLAGIGVPPQAMTRMLLKLTAPGNGDYSGSHPAIEARLESLGFVAGQRPRRE